MVKPSTAALSQHKPPSTRASYDNCCVQNINKSNALYSDSNTTHSILGVKIYVLHTIIIKVTSILAQAEGTGTVFLQPFTDFQSKIFDGPIHMVFKQFLELSNYTQ